MFEWFYYPIWAVQLFVKSSFWSTYMVPIFCTFLLIGLVKVIKGIIVFSVRR